MARTPGLPPWGWGWGCSTSAAAPGPGATQGPLEGPLQVRRALSIPPAPSTQCNFREEIWGFFLHFFEAGNNFPV